MYFAKCAQDTTVDKVAKNKEKLYIYIYFKYILYKYIINISYEDIY